MTAMQSRPSLSDAKPILVVDGSYRVGGRMFTVNDLNYGAGILRQGDVRMKEWVAALGLERSDYHPSFFHSIRVSSTGETQDMLRLLAADASSVYETRSGEERVLLDNERQIAPWGISVLNALRTLRNANVPLPSETFIEWVRRVLPSKPDAMNFLQALVYSDSYEDDVDTVLATYRFEEDNFVGSGNTSSSIKGKWPALIDASVRALEPYCDIQLETRVEGIEWNEIAQHFDVRFQDGRTERARHVALCIPPEQLARLQRVPPVCAPVLQAMISSVRGWPYMRAYVTFPTLEWLLEFEKRHATLRTEEVSESDSISTDTRLGYIIPIDDTTLMLGYCDGQRAKSWVEIDPSEWSENKNDTNVHYASAWPTRPNSDERPPKWLTVMVGELQNRILDSQSIVPPPVSCSAVYWPAGIHITRPMRGRDSSSARLVTVRDARVKSPDSLPGFGVIGIANEAFSTNQGWTEGAVESAQVLYNRVSIAHHSP